MNVAVVLSLTAAIAVAQTAPPAQPAQPVSPESQEGGAMLGGLVSIDGEPEAVRVHINSDSPVELYRITGEGVGTIATSQGMATVGVTHYERECRAPCNKVILEPSHDFFIAGDGIPASARFSLVDHGADVNVNVKSGSTGLRILGASVTTLGLVAAVTGGTLLAISGLAHSGTGPSLGSRTTDDTLNTVGWAGLGGGAVLLGAGIPMILFSGTEVKLAPAPAGSIPTKKVVRDVQPNRPAPPTTETEVRL